MFMKKKKNLLTNNGRRNVIYLNTYKYFSTHISSPSCIRDWKKRKKKKIVLYLHLYIFSSHQILTFIIITIYISFIITTIIYEWLNNNLYVLSICWRRTSMCVCVWERRRRRRRKCFQTCLLLSLFVLMDERTYYLSFSAAC